MCMFLPVSKKSVINGTWVRLEKSLYHRNVIQKNTMDKNDSVILLSNRMQFFSRWHVHKFIVTLYSFPYNYKIRQYTFLSTVLLIIMYYNYVYC